MVNYDLTVKEGSPLSIVKVILQLPGLEAQTHIGMKEVQKRWNLSKIFV